MTVAMLYDAAGRLIRVQQPAVDQPSGDALAQFVAYEYYADGTLKFERVGVTWAHPPTSPAGLNFSGTAAPLDGQLSGDTIQRATRYEYDAAGRVAATEVTFRQDNLVRTISTSIERQIVDGVLVETFTDAAQHQTVTSYDATGRVARVQMPAPGANDIDGHPLPAPLVTYAYYADGRLKSETLTYVGGEDDPDNRVTRYTYDELGRIRTLTAQGCPFGEPQWAGWRRGTRWAAQRGRLVAVPLGSRRRDGARRVRRCLHGRSSALRSLGAAAGLLDGGP